MRPSTKRWLAVAAILSGAALLTAACDGGENGAFDGATASPTPSQASTTATPVALASPTAPAASTATPAPSPVVTLPPGGPGAATGLEAQTECDAATHQGVAKLSWKAAESPGSEQQVMVTIYPGGFEAGVFETSGALPPDQSSVSWERPGPLALHTWRVITRQPEGWVPSETSTFTGPSCLVGIPNP